MQRQIILGNAPFCGNSSSRCPITPGYKAENKLNGVGLKKCWTGHKAVCRYDFNTFRNTPLYRKLKEQNNGRDFPNTFFPTYKWFGTAPFCAPSLNDLADNGYVWVTSDKCGDGKCCIRGQKMIGMKPVIVDKDLELKHQKIILKRDKEEKKKILDTMLINPPPNKPFS